MAFNPFNVFRRNQKAIFAVVTVVIMFVFVLSSGLGGGADFFDAFPQWIGSRKKGDVVATLNGSKLYAGELEAVRRQRHLANRFMALASEVTQDQLGRFIREQQSRMSPEGKAVIDRMLNMERQMAMFASNPQIMQMIVQQNMQELQRLATDGKSKEEDKTVANAYILSMELAQRRAMAGGGEHYFVNLPNQTQRDSIEFLLWQKKADQLGISFTTTDVKALIQKEFMRQFTSDVAVRNAMARDTQGGFSMEATLKAIAEEFRVRAAQTAVIGPVADRTDRTTTAAPIYNPPYEMFQFYREQCSPTTYQVLSVPAENFVGLVTGAPTDDELRRLYDQYKDQEPNPGVEQPGFREPRKIKVEWLSAKGDEPFYKSAATEWLNKGQFAAFIGGALTASPLDAVATAPLALNTNALLESNYETQTVRDHRRGLMFEWGTSTIMPRMLDTSVVKPENLAAAAGAAAGALSSFGMNFGPAMMLNTRATAAEHRARIAVGMPAFLGGVPGPGMFATVMMGEARAQAGVPKPLSLDVVRPELQKTLADKTARKFMIEDLTRLHADLNKPDMVKNREKGDAKKMIADFLAKRGLPSGKSADGEAGWRDEWTIGEEAGLAPVKEALDKSDSNPHGGVSMPVAFGKRFFWEENPRTGARQATRDTYKPEFYPNAPRDTDSAFAKPDTKFLVWRTEDKPAESKPFQVAKPKVIAAWTRIKAREIAKKRAEEIAAAIRKDTPANDMAIRQDLRKFQAELQDKVTPDPKAKERVKFFELTGVCPLTASTDFAMGAQPGSVRPFSLPPSVNVPYPTADMAKTLLDERTNPVKTTVVLTDTPKDTYYVAVVSDRAMKNEAAFKDSVYSESQTAAARGAVNRAHAMESVRKAKESIMTLLKKEFKYVESKEQKEKLDENAKKGGDS